MVCSTRSKSRSSQGSVNSMISAASALSPVLNNSIEDAISLASSADAENLFETAEISDMPSLPESQPEYQRKLFIMPTASNTGEIYLFQHPRSQTPALYMLDKEANPFEMMRLDLAGGRRSIFCGNSVIADPGPIYMFLPVHPIFLILSRLKNKASVEFIPAEEILEDTEFPALRLLLNSKKLMETLKIVADFEVGTPSKFRFNWDRLFPWLKQKFNSLKESVKENEEGMSEGAMLEQHTFGIMADYLEESMAELLQNELGIIMDKKQVETGPKVPESPANRKRLSDNPLGTFISPKGTPVAKKEKKMSRMLAVASKGTQSLKSFFTVSNSLKKEEEPNC